MAENQKVEMAVSAIQRAEMCDAEVNAILNKYGCIVVAEETKRAGMTVGITNYYVPREEIQNFIRGTWSYGKGAVAKSKLIL